MDSHVEERFVMEGIRLGRVHIQNYGSCRDPDLSISEVDAFVYKNALPCGKTADILTRRHR